MECRNMAFTVHLEGGKEVETCCARCGLHYLESERPTVASLTAHDFNGAGEIDAEGAFYVEGSDVTPCVPAGKPPMRDAAGCCADPVYDRCLPSLIAFQSKEAADAFAREHGGTVRRFAELRGSRR
jgi:nitrous oxide reductase accessory protein NosL